MPRMILKCLVQNGIPSRVTGGSVDKSTRHATWQSQRAHWRCCNRVDLSDNASCSRDWTRCTYVQNATDLRAAR